MNSLSTAPGSTAVSSALSTCAGQEGWAAAAAEGVASRRCRCRRRTGAGPPARRQHSQSGGASTRTRRHGAEPGGEAVEGQQGLRLARGGGGESPQTGAVGQAESARRPSQLRRPRTAAIASSPPRLDGCDGNQIEEGEGHECSVDQQAPHRALPRPPPEARGGEAGRHRRGGTDHKAGRPRPSRQPLPAAPSLPCAATKPSRAELTPRWPTPPPPAPARGGSARRCDPGAAASARR